MGPANFRSSHTGYELLPPGESVMEGPDPKNGSIEPLEDLDVREEQPSHERLGGGFEDLEGFSLYEKKSILINREIDSQGMGKYQWYLDISSGSWNFKLIDTDLTM